MAEGSAAAAKGEVLAVVAEACWAAAAGSSTCSIKGSNGGSCGSMGGVSDSR